MNETFNNPQSCRNERKRLRRISDRSRKNVSKFMSNMGDHTSPQLMEVPSFSIRFRFAFDSLLIAGKSEISWRVRCPQMMENVDVSFARCSSHSSISVSECFFYAKSHLMESIKVLVLSIWCVHVGQIFSSSFFFALALDNVCMQISLINIGFVHHIFLFVRCFCHVHKNQCQFKTKLDPRNYVC